MTWAGRIGGWLVLSGEAGVRLARGRLDIAGGVITRVHEAGQGESLGALDLGGDSAVVFPGFVDVHVHIPQFDSIGVYGLELLDWLDRVIFPAEARWADADFAGEMGRRVARELLGVGTTAVAAYGTVHAEGTAAAMRALAETGMAGVMGQALMDRNAPAELIRPAAQLLAEVAAAEPIARIEPAVTPRFAVSCTEELLAGAGRLATERGWAVQTHLAETPAELARVAELFPGESYTGVYERAGLLGARSILAHAIHLSPAERETLGWTHSVTAHCPTANRFLMAGAMDRAGLEQAGVRLALGSDVAGGPDRSMPRVARAMLETAASRGDRPPTAARAWHQITAGNAGVIGRSGHHALRLGAEADVVIAEPTIRWEGSPDPLATLLWGWDERWIRGVLAGGRVVAGG